MLKQNIVLRHMGLTRPRKLSYVYDIYTVLLGIVSLYILKTAQNIDDLPSVALCTVFEYLVKSPIISVNSLINSISNSIVLIVPIIPFQIVEVLITLYRFQDRKHLIIEPMILALFINDVVKPLLLLLVNAILVRLLSLFLHNSGSRGRETIESQNNMKSEGGKDTLIIYSVGVSTTMLALESMYYNIPLLSAIIYIASSILVLFYYLLVRSESNILKITLFSIPPYGIIVLIRDLT
jgi:hypothetical protein